MIAQLLRTETAARHKALESAMFVDEIMSRRLNLSQYRQILAVNLLAHELIEPPLFNVMDQELAQRLDLKSREKLPALRQDAAGAGIDTAALPHVDTGQIFIPADSKPAQLGTLYVLEGATLGGNVIRKQLLQNDEFAGLDFAYYGIYGDQLAEKWKTFQAVLEAEVQSPADAEICLHAANSTFDSLIRLMHTVQAAGPAKS
ncbi:biliverdin-producing heme oxygenase [Pedobacter sp. SYP-B3415]|uniref:biliverdin-producing heme oxygenase n=1 Tax=Pedobacter sp. SYP-B3415 TaxID=2496641 RepID=UPI00101D0535|nr:biliverdin-producing heme oxygenase [Pedobacter sp. SYP-B3415]